MANTVTPTFDANGNIDFSVRSDNGGHWRGSETDYYEGQDGSVHHVFEGVELEEDGEEGYDSQAYEQALSQANPDLPNAIQWATNNLSPDFVEDFNAAMEGDDLSEKNKFIEMLLHEYEEGTNEPQQAQEDPSDDEEVEVDDEQVEAFLEELVQQDPLGEEVADEWNSVISQAEAAGDQTYAGIAAAVASYHAAEVTAEEAIQFVVDNYDMKDIQRVVKYLTA